MSSPLSLYRLQQIDSQIDQITSRLEAIQQTLEDNHELQQIKGQLAEAEAEHMASEKALRQIEGEAESQRTKIAQSEASLYSGNVKNPKELQDIQNEIASLKRHLETLEDRQLEAMMASETTENAQQEMLATLESTRQRLADQNSILTDEQAVLKKDQQRLLSERAAVTVEFDAETLAMYEDLRLDHNGLAVATVTDGSCDACGSTLTPAHQQSARSTTQIAICPTCGRILYTS